MLCRGGGGGDGDKTHLASFLIYNRVLILRVDNNQGGGQGLGDLGRVGGELHHEEVLEQVESKPFFFWLLHQPEGGRPGL